MDSRIKFNYLYRDAGNYKAWGEIVFSNPEELPLQDIEARLSQAFLHDGLFAASQIHVPELFLFNAGHASDDDHCFHEFYSVELSFDQMSDKWKRSVRIFVEQVEFESNHGWQAFSPSAAFK